MPTYVIEHLEPRLWKWCTLEYQNISKIVGKENLIFTNLKTIPKSLEGYGKLHKERVATLDLKRVCILDPEATEMLSPKDKSVFDYFIFGGILGNDPPQKRTGPELTSTFKHFEIRSLGPRQMSTDTAVRVTKMILDGTPFEKIKFIDDPEIELEENESTILPYRYIDDGTGKPLICKELFEHILKRKGL